MNNKKIIAIVIILTACLFILSGCKTKEVENSAGSTSSTTSIRDQLMAQQNLVQGMQQADSETEEIKLENLEVWNKEEDSSYKTLNYTNGASFMYPSDWISVGNETNPAFMSPDAHASSVSVAVDNALKEGNSTLVTDFESYITFTKLYLTQKMTLLSSIEEKWINLNGRKACVINYLTEAEEDESMKLNVTQVSFEDDKEISVITLAVIDEYYEEVKPTFEKMIKSFTK